MINADTDPTAAPTGGAVGSDAAILLIDDDPAKRLALTAVLLPLGYPIVEADSGQAGLRCLLERDFAVILLDVRMPIMDGYETAALIRLRRQSEMTPIIFITAHTSEETADRYAEGAVDFMFAPVSPEELRAKVSVFANIFLNAQALAARALEVQRSADQLRLLTDAAPIGIFQTDAENRFLYTNPCWSAITGIPAEDAAGTAWDAIVASERAAGHIVELADVGQSRAEPGRRFAIQTDAGRRIVLETARTVPDGDGGTVGWVGTLADVTSEADAEAAMAAARDEATEGSRLKSDFLANMSHEIRTPMNGVIGMTDLLLETELDARQRDYAQTVRNSGEALLAIINDILDFSKIEAGKLDIEDIEFSLGSVVHDVADLLAATAQAKGLELVVVLQKSLAATVTGDPGRVRQVLTNLIGNAIKFTHAGEIVVRLTNDALVDGDTVVRFDVSDTGDGIAADKAGLVFQPFVQADTSTSRKYGGTGLGLAISAQLVALMRGSCGVSSRLGEGSTFWFTIRVGGDAARSPHVPLIVAADCGAPTALVVEDNAAQRSVVTEYLTDEGMKVTSADSALAALSTMRMAALVGRPFAVVVVDRGLPEMDGLALGHAIARDPALSAPLVLMTDFGKERGAVATAASGACASLAKPIHRDQLRTCVAVALGLEAAPCVEGGDGRADVMAPAARQTGRLLLAEDNLINQKVAVAMLASAGYVVDTVLNGAAAVEAVGARGYIAILMDCQMPELNGYEATAAIRAQEGVERHTPIIAMTAGARREDRDRCLAAGMDGYLSKPVSKDALLASVARFASLVPSVGAAVPSP